MGILDGDFTDISEYKRRESIDISLRLITDIQAKYILSSHVYQETTLRYILGCLKCPPPRELVISAPLVTRDSHEYISALYRKRAITMESLDVDVLRLDPTPVRQRQHDAMGYLGCQSRDSNCYAMYMDPLTEDS